MQQSLTALWLIEQIEQYTNNNKDVLSITLRDDNYPALKKIQFLKDQASDPLSKNTVVNLIGAELTQKILDYGI